MGRVAAVAAVRQYGDGLVCGGGGGGAPAGGVGGAGAEGEGGVGRDHHILQTVQERVVVQIVHLLAEHVQFHQLGVKLLPFLMHHRDWLDLIYGCF